MTLLEQILISVITAFATATLAYFGYSRKAKAELKKEYHARFNERKWNIYLKFLKATENRDKIWTEIVIDNMYDKGKPFYDSLDPIRVLQEELLLLSSKDVLNCFCKWKRHLLMGDINANIENDLYYQLIQAMRKDLGEKDYVLTKEMQTNLSI